MAERTHIAWTDGTWNPVSGCTRVSPACDHCYIDRTPPLRIARRRFDGPGTGATTGVLLHPERLTQPWRWRKPRKTFVCSLADLFHDEVPTDYLAAVFGVLAAAPTQTFQVLTKRPARMRALLREPAFRAAAAAWAAGHTSETGNPDAVHDWVAHGPWPWPNIWLGVTAEDQHWADVRIPALLDTPAAVRFVSAEPLLGPIELSAAWLRGRLPGRPPRARDLLGIAKPDWIEADAGLDWVIVGGESGPHARPTHPQWAASLHRQCQHAEVAFHFKQWGEWTPMAPLDADGRLDYRGQHVMADDGTLYGPGELAYPDGPRYGEALRADHGRARLTSMYRLGTRRTGRELYHDGHTFDEFPATAQEAPVARH